MKEFKDKVAVITGGASGIGRGIAEHCCKAGMKIVLADVDEAKLAQTASELQREGTAILTVKTDVSKRGDVEQLAQKTLDTFGAVHLLFNNAGVAAGGPPWEATWNDWEWVLGVNLWGVIHGVKVFTPIMLAQNTECHIVNTASAAGLVAGGGSVPYGVSKHGVVALSEGLYLSLQQRKALVGVSVLCPGLVKTDIHDAENHRPVELQNDNSPISPEMQAGRAAFQNMLAMGMPPSQVAEIVFDAIEKEKFYILTHPEWLEVVQLRTDELLRQQNPINPTPTILKVLGIQK